MQVEYEVSNREDSQSGELLISYKGQIEAQTKNQAYIKLAEMKQAAATAGRTLQSTEATDREIDGFDGETWINLSFSFEFRESSELQSWNLRVSTRDDVKEADSSMVYEGKVAGKNFSSALAKARELGLNKLPFMVSANETISTTQREGESSAFIEVSFSYEYEYKGAWKYAEVTRELVADPFGGQQEVISGYSAASTLTEAQLLAQSFKLSGRLLRDVRESHGDRIAIRPSPPASSSQFTRFDFTYTYYRTAVSSSIAYSKADSIDYESLERSVTYTGVARGASEADCNVIIDSVVGAGLTGGKRRQRERTPSYERQDETAESGNAGAGTQMLEVSFTEKWTGLIDGEPGLDIIEAEYSLDITYSINRAVITTIPFGSPHVQTNCGVTIGVKQAAGSVTARTSGAAASWGRSKRASAIAGGYEDPPQERTSFLYLPLSGETVKGYRFEFTYAARFPTLFLS